MWGEKNERRKAVTENVSDTAMETIHLCLRFIVTDY